jgi:hypothetical protein
MAGGVVAEGTRMIVLVLMLFSLLFLACFSLHDSHDLIVSSAFSFATTESFLGLAVASYWLRSFFYSTETFIIQSSRSLASLAGQDGGSVGVVEPEYLSTGSRHFCEYDFALGSSGVDGC